MKRALDVLFSAALLLLSLPVLLISALMIRLTSPGPILFRQVRMGRDFQPFEILKLRTMAHACAGLAYTLGPDPRITPVGKWLRRTKVDELPQLWNVLRGDMSLVGPRPVVPDLTREFHKEYLALLRVRPGLTDPASLKYSQEATLLELSQDPLDFFKTVVTPDKLRLSMAYLERASVLTDLATMAMTALICCFPSLSDRYGQLPQPRRKSDASRDRSDARFTVEGNARVVTHHSATHTSAPETGMQDAAIYSFALAEQEAIEERTGKMPALPWIRSPTGRKGDESASPGRV